MRVRLVLSSAFLLAACSGNSFSEKTDGGGGAKAGSSGAGGTSTSAGGGGGATSSNGGGQSAGGADAAGGGSASGGVTTASGGFTGGAGTRSTGGSASGGRSSGGSGGSIGADAGPPPLTSCPKIAPDSAAICKGTFSCSYGADPRVSCRPVHECHNGRFLVTAVKCPVAKSCIDDYTLKPFSGNVCDPLGDYCEWQDNGSICSCDACSGTACKGVNTWTCGAPVSSPCPLVPPNEGQACDATGATDCKYGQCGISSFVLTHCKAGVWEWDFPICG